ncbi:helix-turn-helix transcriptional regulator [Paenibacillus sp. DXFW5]|uniref:Helix-turn-helix transcriptional regulator n=1 Tax=Paenibacillus rhizolycopersici TaxID=2780073 RepID=A0ABS2H0V3_9BACL|nr:helix-turn-helix transcriptional regulator [Paenibacillus rhizolycopersici]MBM6994975.1 helix-turn-helix transcriptional regulator [Paenibacillus rhizolycopersici]
MTSTTTILAKVSEYMKEKSLTLSQFARDSDINPGTFSSILKGVRLLTVDQLDRITELMDLPKGHYYEAYIKEHLQEINPDWRRVYPLLNSCAELRKLDSIRKVVALLLDNLLYAPLLFELAEELFAKRMHEAAEVLYENVALSERRQHSERLALCHYRLFTIRQRTNHELNYQSAIQFEPFVERLDEMDQLDALKDLAHSYRALRHWDKVDKIASMLETKASILYFKREINPTKKPSRPLFTYLASSYLFHGTVCEVRGEYDRALYYIDLYADLNWVKETDNEVQYWKTLFSDWARANTFVTRLGSGDISILPEYVSYLESQKAEIHVGMLNIVEAANRFGFNIDALLMRLDTDIKNISDDIKAAGVYSSQFVSERSARLFHELAVYYINKSEFPIAFHYLEGSLTISLNINQKSCIIKCVGLYEIYREHLDEKSLLKFQKLIKEVYEHEKKSYLHPVSV